jgi:alpha-soluble NSF attachment protein
MISYLKSLILPPTLTAVEQKQAAESCERNYDLVSAIEKYKIAADMFDKMDSIASFSTCLINAANLSVQLERYNEAIELYERVALKTRHNNLLKWSIEDYLFCASLCRLVLNNLEMDKYEDMLLHQSFKECRQGKFLVELISAIENNDVDMFTDAVRDFESVRKLDPLKVTILSKIKNRLL